MMAHPISESVSISEPTILDVVPWLMELTKDDPISELAMAYVFIDPVATDYFTADYDEDTTWSHAVLEAAAMSMPDVYQDLVGKFWSMPEAKFEKYGIQLMQSYHPAEHYYEDEPYTFQWLGYMAYGESWDHPEWYAPKGIEKIMPLFGYVENEDQEYATDYHDLLKDDDGHIRHKTCQMLIQSLEASSDFVHHNIAMFLRWAFVGSGNTLFDMSYEDLAENGFEYLGWEELDFATTVQWEADEFWEMYLAACEALNTDPILLHSLSTNYETIFRTIKASKGSTDTELINENTHDYTLEWSTYCGQSESVITKSQSIAHTVRFWRDSA